jgi:putative peptidoglycan lipid II flippase
LWSAQAIYIRAFYAAGQTLPPMLAGTVVTVIALPVYWFLHARFGTMGLAWASNFAILLHTLTLAVLLHTRKLVNLGGLNYVEFGKSLVAAFLAFSLVLGARRLLTLPGGYEGDLVNLLGGSALWAVICYVALRLMHSSLPQQLHRRPRPGVR